MGRLMVITGGQYGSEGKGAVAAWLARECQRLLAVRVGGPNAGHTVIGKCPVLCRDSVGANTDPIEHNYNPASIGKHYPDQHPWRLRHIPVAAVTNPGALLLLAAGSEIDVDVLMDEVRGLESAGYDIARRLLVDRSATVIEQHHKDQENGNRGNLADMLVGKNDLVSRIGSTGKGIGAARAARVWREAVTYEAFEDMGGRELYRADGEVVLRQFMCTPGLDVMIEGTQGYGLGVHTKDYPFTTSGDCRAIDFMAQAGVSPWLIEPGNLEIWVTFRTKVIRVAGNSGPLANETTWADLGRPDEYTTVTKKVRRVGAWDTELARKALVANGAYGKGNDRIRVALTMTDYDVPAAAGAVSLDKMDPDTRLVFTGFLSEKSMDLGFPIALAGTAPDTMIDLRHVKDGDTHDR